MANIGSGNGTTYPSALDTQSPPESGTTVARDDVPNDLAAVAIAIETELGINPAGTEVNVKTYLQKEHRLDGTHGEMTSTKLTMTGDFLFSLGATVSSASVLSLGSGTIFPVAGTVDINSINTKGLGGYIILQFNATLTLVNDNDNLKLLKDIVTVNGTVVTLYEYAIGKWRLVSDNSLVTLPPFRGALVFKSANQNITIGTLTILTWNQEVYDTSNLHNNTNSSRLTVPAGVTRVRLNANVSWAQGVLATAGIEIELLKNAAPFRGGFHVFVEDDISAATGGLRMNGSSPPLLVTGGDFFEVRVRQNTSISLNVEADGGNGTWFAMELIE